ncbi:MAG: hypothetical protein IPI34_13745 [bacterium]|nr:hypothetical protein [bacterium]
MAAHATESLEVAADICDGEGRFQLIQLAPLDVRLRFSCNGLSRWHGGVSFGTAEQFALQAGDRITGVDVVESGIEIRLDGPGDLEQREVRIRICDETGSVLASTESTHNPILIGNLLPGRILLQLDGVCNEQTWAGQWFDGAVSPAGATPIDLVAGERRRIDVVLAPGGLIAGVVLQAGGSAPASVHVAVCSDSGAPLCSWPSYSYDGEFLFNGLADGDYLLKVDLGGGGAWWYPGTYEIDHAAAIGIVDHGAVTGLSWTLPASTAGARR